MDTPDSGVKDVGFHTTSKTNFRSHLAKGIIALLVTIVSLPLLGCASGTVAEEHRSVGDFTNVSSTASAIIRIDVGKTKSVRITASRSVLKSVLTKVSAGTLYIDTTDDFLPPDRPVIDITIPRLDSITTSGIAEGDLSVADLTSGIFGLEQDAPGRVEIGGELDGLIVSKSGSGDLLLHNLTIDGDANIDMAGEGDMRLEDVNAGTLVIRKDEGGDIELRNLNVDGDLTLDVAGGWGEVEGGGTANNLIIRKFGFGDILLSDMVSQNVDVRMWDSGNVEVCPAQSITGFNAGDGDLVYVASSPTLNVDVNNTGTGAVRTK